MPVSPACEKKSGYYGRDTPKQSFDFKKRTFDSPSIPGAYLFARNISTRESLRVRTVSRTHEARTLCT